MQFVIGSKSIVREATGMGGGEDAERTGDIDKGDGQIEDLQRDIPNVLYDETMDVSDVSKQRRIDILYDKRTDLWVHLLWDMGIVFTDV